MNITRRFLRLNFRTCLLLWVIAMLFAHSLPVLAAPPPSMPQTFDRSTVQSLIDTIEQGENATILKVGYFLRRLKEPFPVDEGYALLKSARDKEAPNSKRWFALQSVLAWAAFYAGPGRRAEGYESYHQIFSHAERARDDSQEIIQRSIYEYALVLTGQFGTRNFGIERSKEILLTALGTHLTYLKNSSPTTYKVPWREAVKAVGDSSVFTSAVDDAIKDDSFKKTYVFLRTAAAIYSITKPKQAVEFLLQAKAVMPAQDKVQLQSTYDELIPLLERTGQPAQAIAVQQELVNLTGGGRARLAVLQLQSNDEKGFGATIRELEAQDISEEEIMGTVWSLRKSFDARSSRGDKAFAATERVLTNYLASHRSRSVEHELSARVLLGQQMLQKGRNEEAKKILDVAHLQSFVLTPTQRALYSDAKNLLEQISTAQ